MEVVTIRWVSEAGENFISMKMIFSQIKNKSASSANRAESTKNLTNNILTSNETSLSSKKGTLRLMILQWRPVLTY